MFAKKVLLLFVFVLFVSPFLFKASAQPGIPSGIEEEGEKVTNVAGRIQEFASEEHWEYVGEAWKQRLLEIPAIKKMDEVFTKLNPLFVFLFARDYVLSFALFIAFLIWLFTALSIEGYLYFIENKSLKALGAFALTIVIAHMQIFNYLSQGALNAMFYRSEWWWSVISAVLILAAIVLYLLVNKIFAKKIRKRKEENEKEETKHRVKKLEVQNDYEEHSGYFGE